MCRTFSKCAAHMFFPPFFFGKKSELRIETQQLRRGGKRGLPQGDSTVLRTYRYTMAARARRRCIFGHTCPHTHFSHPRVCLNIHSLFLAACELAATLQFRAYNPRIVRRNGDNYVALRALYRLDCRISIADYVFKII
ncbi:hypothetical protein PUN28_004818 [Cardiocondyla obscurior]|uniref:Uncharacterized protein n=1 Tax=Cardiocondyla obscurior TaxID=286306 RepID=A0AAW2GIS1_9HYME